MIGIRPEKNDTSITSMTSTLALEATGVPPVLMFMLLSTIPESPVKLVDVLEKLTVTIGSALANVAVNIKKIVKITAKIRNR